MHCFDNVQPTYFASHPFLDWLRKCILVSSNTAIRTCPAHAVYPAPVPNAEATRYHPIQVGSGQRHGDLPNHNFQLHGSWRRRLRNVGGQEGVWLGVLAGTRESRDPQR